MNNSEGIEKAQSKELKDTQPPPNPPSPMKIENSYMMHAEEMRDIDEDKILISEFIANPENKKAAGTVAFQIQKAFPGWFKIPQLVKLFDTSTDQVAKQIEMLMLFNLCVGKVEKKVPLFKIDLDRKVQRTLLLEQIAEKEGEVLFLRKKLSDLD